jgi:hypothetical protein
MVSTPSFASDDCEFCDRGAVVSKCENPDMPANWEEIYEPYWECMDREEPKDDPNVTMSQEPGAFASQRCKHLDPRIDFTTASSIATRIAEIHTTACFHMIGRDIVEQYRARGEGEGWSEFIKPPGYKIPEYAFEVVFDSVAEEIVNREGKPGSSLTIDLYYDGDERIHVKSWKTTSPTYTITSHTHRMFKNPDAPMRQAAPQPRKSTWQGSLARPGPQSRSIGSSSRSTKARSSTVNRWSPTRTPVSSRSATEMFP